MIFNEFVEYTTKWWQKYFTKISDYHQKGNLDTKGGSILYPNLVLGIKANGYFVAELIGASRNFNGLTQKKYKVKSIYSYLDQFDGEEPCALLFMDQDYQQMRYVCLSQNADYDVVQQRFPFIKLYKTKLTRVGGKGSLLEFGPNFKICFIECSALVNNRNNVFRCKSVLEMIIVKSTINLKDLSEFYKRVTQEDEVKGIYTVYENSEESLIIGGQLQSMYLSHGLRETTIGEYIKTHPEVIKKAFNTSYFLYEPYLRWIEKPANVEEDAINPDLMIKRSDNFFDIYDLKTAVLTRDKIIKGERKRRRFIDYVEEGVAQLANYREYFTYPKNKEYAFNKYGIEIKDPKLILIVGNWENATLQEINEACLRYKDVTIIDYDTFIHLFLGTNNTLSN